MENNEEKKQIQLTKNDLIINRRLSKLFSLINNNFIPEKIVCPNRIDNRVFLYYIIDRERGYLYETKI